jgi:ligand-binding SRPBCC domain-containing protein
MRTAAVRGGKCLHYARVDRGVVVTREAFLEHAVFEHGPGQITFQLTAQRNFATFERPMAQLTISETIPANRFDVFDYLTDVRNLPDLLSRALEIEVAAAPTELKRGAEAHLTMARFGFTQTVRWQVEDVLRGSRLSFRQVEGIFESWTHTVRFEDEPNGETRVTDLIAYKVPGGLIGRLADDVLIKSDLDQMLRARLRRARDHFTKPRPKPEQLAGG